VVKVTWSVVVLVEEGTRPLLRVAVPFSAGDDSFGVSPRAGGTPQVWLLDLDGIRRWRRLPRARRVQNLARLHVSLAAQGVDSTWLRVRFLQVYLAGSGEDWRDWWNWVASAAQRKQDQNARRGRPIS